LTLADTPVRTDEALTAFNHIMEMETFSLLDDDKQSILRGDLNLDEVYKTRLLRIDLGTRSRTDPFQRWIHKCLRLFRYQRLSQISQNDSEELRDCNGHRHRWSGQNTILIAEIIGRIMTEVLTVVFLVTPLVILSHQSSKNIQLVIISVCILLLAFIVSICLKVSSFEMMAVSASYAAILSVFVSNIGC
jgi:hypothetical protein